MSNVNVSIRINPGAEFSVDEVGNHTGEVRPITDDTGIYINLDGGVYLVTTIGQFRQMVADVERGIGGIPDARGAQRALMERCEARRQARIAAEAVPA